MRLIAAAANGPRRLLEPCGGNGRRGFPELVTKPSVAEALRHAPDLCGRAVIGALSRDWRRTSDSFLTVGMCCPATGVPVLVALRLWKGIGGQLHFASRLERDYEAIWKSNRTVVIAQGSGRATVEAMVDGLAEDHWTQLTATDRKSLRPGMGQRWDKAHDRIGVLSPRELAAAATGLVPRRRSDRVFDPRRRRLRRGDRLRAADAARRDRIHVAVGSGELRARPLDLLSILVPQICKQFVLRTNFVTCS